MKIWQKIIDWIYPEQPYCYYCGQDYFRSEVKHLCDNCLSGFKFNESFCTKCGRELLTNGEELCADCQADKYYFKMARSCFIYQGTARQLLLRMKYLDQPELAEPIGDLLYVYFCENYNNLSIDYIMPVPLHVERLSMRGYNQSLLLAEILAKKTGIKLVNDLLFRDKNTLPLFSLSKEARQSELDGVFRMSMHKNYQMYDNTNILIVDDIYTTGSTVNEVSKVLQANINDLSIYILTPATVSLIAN